MKISFSTNHRFSIVKTVLLVGALFLHIETTMASTKDNKIETIKYLSYQKDAALLIAAVDAGKVKIVKALIEDGVDINIPLLGDGTALMIAIQNKDITVINALLSLNASPNIISPGDGSPLIIAAKNGNIDIAKILLQHGANVNIFAEGDETPLINASRKNNISMVKFLVEHGADIDFIVKGSVFSRKDQTAINQSKSKQIKKYLLQQSKLQKDSEKPHDLSKYNQLNKHYSKVLADIKKRYKLPSISIAININGKTVWAEAQGLANVEKNIPATIDTQYAVGSIAKPMTTLAMARLIEQKKLDLNQPIVNYGTYNLPLQHITPYQLASHTAGIVHYNKLRENREFKDVRDHFQPAEALNIFDTEKLLFNVGTDFSYSSNGYILLSDVIGNASHKSYIELMNDEVFTPLNMNNTEHDTSLAGLEREAIYYKNVSASGEYIPATTLRDRSFLFGGGGFISTPSDLVNMAWGLQEKNYLSTHTKNTLFTPVKLTNGEVNRQSYALGWRVNELPLQKLFPNLDTAQLKKKTVKGIHHGGTVAGAASAYLMFFPDTGVSISFATNTIPKNETKHQNIRQEMWKILYQYSSSTLYQN